jgi:hypothetical protein
MADRRLIATDITDSGQVEQIARGAMATYANDRAVAFIATTLWSWMIAHIDDDGRIIGKPAALRSKIFARYLDLVAEHEVAEVIAWMNDVDLVVWYEVRGSPGERYLYSPRFTVHQTLRGDRYGPSRHPAPPSWKPEEGHPYTKVAELAKTKPQRDNRPTVRVAKRPINRPPRGLWETAAQPERDQPAPAAQPESDQWLRSGDGTNVPLASQRTSPNVPRPSAEPRAAAPLSESTGELRSERAAGRAPKHTLEAQLEGDARAARIIALSEFLTTIADDDWRDVLQELASWTTNARAIETWFQGSALEPLDDTRRAWHVVLRSELDHEFVRSHYTMALRASVSAVMSVKNEDLRLTFGVRDQVSEATS